MTLGSGVILDFQRLFRGVPKRVNFIDIPFLVLCALLDLSPVVCDWWVAPEAIFATGSQNLGGRLNYKLMYKNDSSW